MLVILTAGELTIIYKRVKFYKSLTTLNDICKYNMKVFFDFQPKVHTSLK